MQQRKLIQSEQRLPKTYFDLIEKVGSKGIYQRNVFFLFFAIWFIAAFLLLGQSFLFLAPSFDCQGKGLLVKNCQKTVCKLSQSEWQDYVQKDINFTSITTQYGPFYCSDKETLSWIKACLFIGTFVGYVVILFFTDNFGRKFSMIMAWGSTLVGVIILACSVNAWMAGVALFICGIGTESSLRICMSVVGQTVDYYLRQKYSIAYQIAFGSSGVLVGIIYYLIGQWRYITIGFVVIPVVISFFLLIFYFEETPKFLMKKGKQQALRALNRIGRINKGEDNLITEDDLDSVYAQQCDQNEKFNKMVTPIDLIRFTSLRKNTICMILIFFFTTILYFGPTFIVEQLGFNAYVSQIVISSSQTLAYPISFLLIQKLPRIKTGIILMSISTLCTGILVFVQKPEDCQICFESILQISMVFFSRFLLAFYISVMFLQISELYPSRARGMGYGIASAFGAIGSSAGQPLLNFLVQNQINTMILFTLLSLLTVFTIIFLQQTLNLPLKDEISQIQLQKDNFKTISKKGTFQQHENKKVT